MRGRSDSLKLGDIVVAQSPPEPGRMVVKRVVGLPGDFIQVNLVALNEVAERRCSAM